MDKKWTKNGQKVDKNGQKIGEDKMLVFPFFLLENGQRVARWFVFKPKIPIRVNFGGASIGKCFYVLWPFGIFYGDWGYFMTIWYILYSFCAFFPVFGIMYQEKSGNPASV
jgi:hypothetical protein